MPKLDFAYIAEKFLRDTAMFFVATDVVRQIGDGVGFPSLESLGVAFVGAAGTAIYRAVRDLGFTEG